MNTWLEMVNAHFELELSYERTWEEWRQECNRKGLEIYYDMTDAVERGTFDSDTGEVITAKVGGYRTRPCPNHHEGHVCNPPRYGKITGLSTCGLSL